MDRVFSREAILTSSLLGTLCSSGRQAVDASSRGEEEKYGKAVCVGCRRESLEARWERFE